MYSTSKVTVCNTPYRQRGNSLLVVYYMRAVGALQAVSGRHPWYVCPPIAAFTLGNKAHSS